MLRIDSFIHSRSSHMVQNNFLGAQTHYKPTGNIQISFADDLGVENNIYKVRQEFYSQNAVPPIQLPQGRNFWYLIQKAAEPPLKFSTKSPEFSIYLLSQISIYFCNFNLPLSQISIYLCLNFYLQLSQISIYLCFKFQLLLSQISIYLCLKISIYICLKFQFTFLKFQFTSHISIYLCRKFQFTTVSNFNLPLSQISIYLSQISIYKFQFTTVSNFNLPL